MPATWRNGRKEKEEMAEKFGRSFKQPEMNRKHCCWFFFYVKKKFKVGDKIMRLVGLPETQVFFSPNGINEEFAM